jgi:hypothetical protein
MLLYVMYGKTYQRHHKEPVRGDGARKVKESWAEPSATESQKIRPSVTISLEYSISLVSNIACSFLLGL